MFTQHIDIGEAVRFGVTISNPSGGALINADETPRYTIFEEASDTPILTGLFTQRTGFDGTYRGTFNATGANGFDPSSYYEIHASGKVNGIVGRTIVDSFVLNDVVRANIMQVSGVTIIPEVAGRLDANMTHVSGVRIHANSLADTYYANIKFIKDAPNDADEYTVNWFKNALNVPSGNITNPALSVLKTNDGTSLFQNQTLNYASTTLGVLRHNESINIAVSGEPYLVITSGTINAAIRTWKLLIGLDDF